MKYLLLLALLIPTPSYTQMHGLEEYTFDVFCRASGNIAVMAKSGQPNLQEILSGIHGDGFSANHNDWFQAIIDFGIDERATTHNDKETFMAVYTNCLDNSFAKKVYLENAPSVN